MSWFTPKTETKLLLKIKAKDGREYSGTYLVNEALRRVCMITGNKNIREKVWEWDLSFLPGYKGSL